MQTEVRIESDPMSPDKPQATTVKRQHYQRILILVAVALSLLAWQGYDFRRTQLSVKESMRSSARDMANTLGVVMRSQGRFGFIPKNRLEAALGDLAESTDIEGIAVLNQYGESTASAGKPVDLDSEVLTITGERWDDGTVTFVNLVDLGAQWEGGESSDAKFVIVTADNEPMGRPGGGFRGRFRPPPAKDSLNEEVRATIESMQDGQPMTEMRVATLLDLVCEEMPDENRRNAIHTLLVGNLLDPKKLDLALDIALMDTNEREASPGDRKFHFPRDLLTEEANQLLDKISDGRILEESDVESILSFFPADTLDENRRATIMAMMAGAPFDEIRMRLMFRVAFAGLEERVREHPVFRRPPWLNEEEFAQVQRAQGAHWFVLTLSDLKYKNIIAQDLRLRGIIVFAGLLALFFLGLAWRTIERSSDLNLRLIRAKDLNLHLREMNVAAAGLVHETKNPLNVVRGLAQMMTQNESAPESLRNTALKMTEEVDRVSNRLNQFLDYSRPPEIKLAPTNVKQLVEGVCGILESDRKEKEVALSVIGPELTVEADEALLRQVVFNLLLNAFQATGDQGTIQILIHKLTHNRASIEVRDDGPGVPEEARDNIFKPYFTTTQDGSGLGLTIVRQIILAHQWEITYTALPEGGASFTVTGLHLLSEGSTQHES